MCIVISYWTPKLHFARRSRSRISSRHLSSLHEVNHPPPIKYGTDVIDCSRYVGGRGVALRVWIASLQDEGGALQRRQEAHDSRADSWEYGSPGSSSYLLASVSNLDTLMNTNILLSWRRITMSSFLFLGTFA